MTSQTEPGPTQRRTWERQDYQSSTTLVLENGSRHEGKTVDASLGGIFILLPAGTRKIIIGQNATLEINANNPDFAIPCTIVRITAQGVGVNFTDNHAAFANFATHDMLLDLLTSINNEFAVTLDLDATLDISVSHIKNYLQSEAASLFMVDEKTNEIVCRACSGPVDVTGVRLKMGEGIVGRVIQSAVAHIIQDVREDAAFSKRVDDTTGFRTQSVLCAPLRIRDQTFGALEVINKRGYGLFTTHDRTVLTAMASATAMAIHNARQTAALIEKDALEHANRAKSDFISSMSHELRTPLNAILGFAQFLLSDPNATLRDCERDSIRHIISGGEQLQALVNEVLDLAKIESGKFSMQIAEISPCDVIEESMDTIRALADKQSILLINETQDMALPSIWADPKRFRQILLNLLSNAVKYNRDSGRVSLTAQRTTDNMMRFSVTDTGPGISKAMQEHIFVPFNRLDMEHSTHEGTGIGLTISHNLIELMGGRIGFESTPGKGSTFWIDIPIAGEAIDAAP